jgi:transcriptional regulator with XRE-family HTH domain
MARPHPGERLAKFRDDRKVPLREAARQLHVAHPTLKDWEIGRLVPSPAYRAAIEIWTGGIIAADDWPVTMREAEIAANTAKVRPFVDPKAEPSAA